MARFQTWLLVVAAASLIFLFYPLIEIAAQSAGFQTSWLYVTNVFYLVVLLTAVLDYKILESVFIVALIIVNLFYLGSPSTLGLLVSNLTLQETQFVVITSIMLFDNKRTWAFVSLLVAIVVMNIMAPTLDTDANTRVVWYILLGIYAVITWAVLFYRASVFHFDNSRIMQKRGLYFGWVVFSFVACLTAYIFRALGLGIPSASWALYGYMRFAFAAGFFGAFLANPPYQTSINRSALNTQTIQDRHDRYKDLVV